MKKFATLLIVISTTVNGWCQEIEKFIGEYSVTDIWCNTNFIPNYCDTTFRTIEIEKNSENQLAILHFKLYNDTLFATVNSDSFKFSQTFYYDESNYLEFIGSGKLTGDTLNYEYTSGGPAGLFKGNCVAIKKDDNLINNLIQNNKSLINLYSTHNRVIQLQLKSKLSGEIILYTPDGKQVLKKPVTGKESTICTPTSGLLLYLFTSEKGEVQTGKIMVR